MIITKKPFTPVWRALISERSVLKKLEKLIYLICFFIARTGVGVFRNSSPAAVQQGFSKEMAHIKNNCCKYWKFSLWVPSVHVVMLFIL